MKPLPALSMCLLSLVLTLPVSAADRTEEVRATEVAFAKRLQSATRRSFSRISPTTLNFSDGSRRCTGSKK
jgi:hypothetical protein